MYMLQNTKIAIDKQGNIMTVSDRDGLTTYWYSMTKHNASSMLPSVCNPLLEI